MHDCLHSITTIRKHARCKLHLLDCGVTCFTSCFSPTSYLREVGFPDNVLEARVARMTAYKNLYRKNQLEQPLMNTRSESPPPNVSMECVVG